MKISRNPTNKTWKSKLSNKSFNTNKNSRKLKARKTQKLKGSRNNWRGNIIKPKSLRMKRTESESKYKSTVKCKSKCNWECWKRLNCRNRNKSSKNSWRQLTNKSSTKNVNGKKNKGRSKNKQRKSFKEQTRSSWTNFSTFQRSNPKFMKSTCKTNKSSSKSSNSSKNSNNWCKNNFRSRQSCAKTKILSPSTDWNW